MSVLSTFAQDDERAYYEWFYNHHFDIEQMTKAIGKPMKMGVPKIPLPSPQDWQKTKKRLENE